MGSSMEGQCSSPARRADRRGVRAPARGRGRALVLADQDGAGVEKLAAELGQVSVSADVTGMRTSSAWSRSRTSGSAGSTCSS